MSRAKLKLIDNYVKVNRLLFKCKGLVFSTPKNVNQSELNLFVSAVTKLKSTYEELILNCGLFDDSFILLKQQLSNAIINNKFPKKLNYLDYLDCKKEYENLKIKNDKTLEFIR